MTSELVTEAVRQRYSQVASKPDGAYNFRVGRSYAEELGYPAALLDILPEGAIEAFTGVATPSLQADVAEGETVVDLGCGAGLDLIVLSSKVGVNGKAIGIDFAPTMVERARRNVAELGLRQVDVHLAAADDTGLADASCDWVVANGILNLSPDKASVIREVARILRPGGRFLVAETTLHRPIPAGEFAGIDDWFR